MDVKDFGTSLETLLHRFENQRIGLALIWLLARCGPQKGVSIRAAELAVVLGVSKVWACRILNDLLEDGYIESCKQGVNSGVNSEKYWGDNRLKKYDLTICYDKIFKEFKNPVKLDVGVNSGVNKAETNSPCDVGEVVQMKAKAKKTVVGTDKFIAAYIDAYRSHPKYGNSPHVKGAQAGCAKRIVQECGLDRAIDLMRSYLEMPDGWFCTKHHDLKTMADNLPKIMTFNEKGRFMTRGEAQGNDRMATNRQVLQDFLEEDRRREACT